MKCYMIYRNAAGNYKAIKQGWSWPAFLFTAIWAMLKGIWQLSSLSIAILALVCFAAFIVIGAIPQTDLVKLIDLFAVYLAYLVLAVSFLMGAKGNQWLSNHLADQGYRYKDMISANTATMAITLYKQQQDNKSFMVA